MDNILKCMTDNLPKANFQSLEPTQIKSFQGACDSLIDFLVQGLHGSTVTLWNHQRDDGEGQSETTADSVMGIKLQIELLDYARDLYQQSENALAVTKLIKETVKTMKETAYE